MYVVQNYSVSERMEGGREGVGETSSPLYHYKSGSVYSNPYQSMFERFSTAANAATIHRWENDS